MRLLDPKTGQLLREHLRQTRGQRRIRPEDRPSKTPATTTQLLAKAERAGGSIGAVCRAIHAADGEPGVRRVLGILSLARKYGAASAEEACTTALEVGAPTYRFVRRYLDRQPAPRMTLRQVDPLIRQLTHYRDLIERATKETA